MLPGRAFLLSLIVSMPAAATCIYTLDEPRVYEQTTPYEGAFAADFDGDDLLDIGITSGETFTIRYGIGGGNLSAPSTFGLRVIGVADLQGDARPDLILPGLAVAENRGGRDFAAPEIIAEGAIFVAADFAGSIETDLVIASENAVTLYERRGDAFVRHAPQAVGHAVKALAAGDIDGDSRMDVLALSADGKQVSILRGDGQGGFAKSGAVAPFTSGVAFDAADLDGDHRDDIIIASQHENFSWGRVDVFYGGGTSRQSLSLPVDGVVGAVSVHDFNADGRPDVLVPMSQRPVVLLSNAAGRLVPPTRVVFGVDSSPVAVGDFNGDDLPDLAFPSLSGFAIIRGTGGEAFEFPRELDPALRSPVHTIGDVNRDGVDDVVFQDNDYVLSLAVNDRHGLFTVTKLPLQFDDYEGNVHITNGDIVAVEHFYTQTVLHVLNGTSGAERFTYESPVVPVIMHVPSAAYMEARTADFDGDGVNEIALVEGKPEYVKTLKVFSGLTHSLLFAFEAGVHAGADLLIDDIDGDRRLDLVLTTSGTPQFGGYSMWPLPDGAVRLFSGNGDGTFDAPLTLASAFSPGRPHSGDFNADGRRDLVYETERGAFVQYAAGNGFAAPALLTAREATFTTVEVRDLNEDGIEDIVASHHAAEIEIFFGGAAGLELRRLHWSQPAVPARLSAGGPISLLVPAYVLHVLDTECIPPTRRRAARS